MGGEPGKLGSDGLELTAKGLASMGSLPFSARCRPVCFSSTAPITLSLMMAASRCLWGFPSAASWSARSMVSPAAFITRWARDCSSSKRSVASSWAAASTLLPKTFRPRSFRWSKGLATANGSGEVTGSGLDGAIMKIE